MAENYNNSFHFFKYDQKKKKKKKKNEIKNK